MNIKFALDVMPCSFIEFCCLRLETRANVVLNVLCQTTWRNVAENHKCYY